MNDIVSDQGFCSYQIMCAMLGNAPSRILEYNVVSSAVIKYLREINDTLVDTKNGRPLFYGKLITTVSCFTQELVNMKTDKPGMLE